ncbi:MAG TPA: hypothetical protein VGR20_20350 [Acidimicrobiia bacterium]|nr:hypothetical protein [Acidimicrobiia bacterium]
MNVTIDPPDFSIVDYDAGRIAAVVAEVGALVGLPDDVRIQIAVDEQNPFGKTSTAVAGRSVTVSVEGGAFEDPQRLRQFSESNTRLVLGRLLFRIADRLNPAFGDPPADADLTPAEHTAWDAYAVGRFSRRAGVDGGRDRRRYAFRIRHGFSDAADRAFDGLWTGSDLSWAEIQAACR